ncbi:MAG: hypothetical protein U0491_00015 [Candidatus Saccharimonadales bacterium]
MTTRFEELDAVSRENLLVDTEQAIRDVLTVYPEGLSLDGLLGAVGKKGFHEDEVLYGLARLDTIGMGNEPIRLQVEEDL